MGITIREVNSVADIEKIIEICRPEVKALSELKDYRKKYFTESGENKNTFIAFPDTILMAEYNGRLVGYLHFYEDCYEGYEKVLVSLNTIPLLFREDAEKVKQKLEEEFRYWA